MSSNHNPPAAAAAASDGHEMLRRRRRLILHNFYGTESNSGAKSDPTNIDDPSFDVEAYFETLLKSQGVKKLLESDETMLRDIKKLDSGMKTLVYENYNKFISATDTIRDMRSNVENMEEEMNRLAQNMDKITETTEYINNTLAPRR